MKLLEKLNLDRLFPTKAVADVPVFGAPVDAPLSDNARKRMRQPIIAGVVVVLVFVVGLGLWAAIAPIWGAVIAPGVVRVEANRKTLKSRDGGVVRQINVRDGDVVRPNQVLIRFDDTVPKAQVQVLNAQHDNVVMQYARFQAETRGLRVISVPAGLSQRQADPAVAAVVQNETLVFSSRLAAIEGQAAILNQRVDQLRSARGGLDVQVQSIDEQVGLIRQELDGYQKLYEQGYAPRTLILRYQRQLAEIAGRRGALAADIQRNQQQSGETRLQLAQLYEQRASEAATGLRDAEAKLADLGPRLDAARETLALTEVRSPAAGYVLNLSQFTVGGVAGAGEPLLDVVPSSAPLVVSVRVSPRDIDEVHPGMTADVSLMAYNSRVVPKLQAEVLTVSADALTVPETGESYFRADLRVKPEELRKLPRGAHLAPGMQATAMIRTGRRTIMSFLIGPIGQMINASMREQ